MSEEKRLFFEFGSFRVDTAQRILFRGGEPVRLAPKTFDLLLALIEDGNRVVVKEELMRKVWADAFVEEANLTVHVSALRKILGSENGGNSYIETIPKRGYRFVADVKRIHAEKQYSEKISGEIKGSSENGDEFKKIEQPQLAGEQFDTMSERPTENQFEQAAEPKKVSKTETKDARFSPTALTANRSSRNKILISAALLFLVLAAASFAFYKFSDFRQPFQAMKIIRISDTGKTGEAAISPDGKYLAHVVREPGKQSLQVKHIATNSVVQIVAPVAVSFSPLTFSNDGGYIYYVLRQTGVPNALYQIPVLGGEPKKILENIAGAISFAPDGKRFAFVREISTDETALMIADLSGGEQRQLTTRRKPEHFHSSGAMWSPDGKTVACAGGSSSGERLSNIYAVSVETGEIQPISNRKWRAIERGAWLADGTGIIVAAMDVEGQEAFQIWEFPFSGGEPRRVTNDLNDYGGVSLTADAKTLVTIQFEVRRNIWLVPDLETKKAVSLTDGINDSFRFVSWTPDKKIVYPSLASGTRDIWTMDADGGNRKQLTATPHNDILPVASGDNRYIVFASNRAASGTVNIWRINADGKNPVQLTFGNDESQPSVTPDGKWVLYAAGGNDAEPEKRTVWKVPIDGGEPVQLTTDPSFGADVSPDGKHFVCRYKENQSSPWKAAIIPIEGGQPTELLNVAQGSPLRWAPDGAAITYIKTQNGVSNIWSQPLSGEAAKQLTDFTAEQIFMFDWSGDNQLVCSRGVTTQEAVLISDFR